MSIKQYTHALHNKHPNDKTCRDENTAFRAYVITPFRVTKIVLTLILIAAILLGSSSISFAQQTNSQSEAEAASADQNDSGALRLEQTIRANKEQPQVLTIVPWQLPTHQRINETQTWQPIVDQLPNIERSQFLRDLSIVDTIQQSTQSENGKTSRP